MNHVIILLHRHTQFLYYFHVLWTDLNSVHSSVYVETVIYKTVTNWHGWNCRGWSCKRSYTTVRDRVGPYETVCITVHEVHSTRETNCAYTVSLILSSLLFITTIYRCFFVENVLRQAIKMSQFISKLTWMCDNSSILTRTKIGWLYVNSVSMEYYSISSKSLV